MIKRLIIYICILITFFSCSGLNRSLKIEGVYKFTFLKSLTSILYIKKNGELSVKTIDYSRRQKIVNEGKWREINDSVILVNYTIAGVNRIIIDTLDVIKKNKDKIYSLQSKSGNRFYKKNKIFYIGVTRYTPHIPQ